MVANVLRVLSNQHLIVSLGFAVSRCLCTLSLAAQLRFASYCFDFLSEGIQDTHTHTRSDTSLLKSVADSLFTQRGASTPLIHPLVYLHFQLIASIMRSDSDRSPSFVRDP